MELLPCDEESSIFLSVGKMYYQLWKILAISRSHYIQWCLKLDPKPKFVREVSLMADDRITLIDLNSKSISEVTLTKLAHYIQTGCLIGLNVFTVAEVYKAAKALAVPEVVDACTDHLLQLLLPDRNGQKLDGMDQTSQEIWALLCDGNCPLQFPNRTFFAALTMADRMLQAYGHFQWECTWHSEEKILQTCSATKVVDTSQMPGCIFPKRKNMFQNLSSDVAPENYVYDDSEILHMMELTSVHRDGEEEKELKSRATYQGKAEVSSPKTLPEEWLLSPAKSVDLEKEFGEIDKDFLHLVYDDSFNI